ncbi:MAG: YihY/virulence factor BrkB family protein [Bacteroidetes bacterium]|nr:YihY/virulence factor BrkB family protein [Bacteroidota bacterium]
MKSKENPSFWSRLFKPFKSVYNFGFELINAYIYDRSTTMGASIAFYTIFSLAPIFVIVIAIAGFFAGTDAVRGELESQLSSLIGPSVADMTNQIVENAYLSGDSIWATILSVLMLLIGATTVVGELKNNLNYVWGIQEQPENSILSLLRNRFLSLSFVVSLGFIMLVSLVLNAALVAFSARIASTFPSLEGTSIINFSNVLSFLVTMIIFALLFKYLPDAKVKWKHVWAGAVFTAILFALGKYLIGFYLGNSTIASSYGAAGALVALLIWVYYSAQIVILGAEFTKIWSRKFGEGIRPAEHAVRIKKQVVQKPEKMEE